MIRKKFKKEQVKQIVAVLLCLCLALSGIAPVFAYEEQSQETQMNEPPTDAMTDPGSDTVIVDAVEAEESGEDPDNGEDGADSPAEFQAVDKSVVATEDGSLRLRYELWPNLIGPDTIEQIAANGIAAVFPDELVCDPLKSDPDGLIGFTQIVRGDELWEMYVGSAIDILPDKDSYNQAVIWTPTEETALPESFVYYAFPPEGITDVGQIMPVFFLSGGTMLPYVDDTQWENAELLVNSEELDDISPEGDPAPEESGDLHINPEESGDIHVDTGLEDQGDLSVEDSGDVVPEEAIPGESGDITVEPLPEEGSGDVTVEPLPEEEDGDLTVEPLPGEENGEITIQPLPEEDNMQVEPTTDNQEDNDAEPAPEDQESEPEIEDVPEDTLPEDQDVESDDDSEAENQSDTETDPEYQEEPEEYPEDPEDVNPPLEETPDILVPEESETPEIIPEEQEDLSVNTPEVDENETGDTASTSTISVFAPAISNTFCTFNYEFSYPEGVGTSVSPEASGVFTLMEGENRIFEGIPTGTYYTFSLFLQGNEAYEQTSWEGTLSSEGCSIEPVPIEQDSATETGVYTAEADGAVFTAEVTGLPEGAVFHADAVTENWTDIVEFSFPGSLYQLYDFYFTDANGESAVPVGAFTVTVEPAELYQEGYTRSAFAILEGIVITPEHSWQEDNTLQIVMNAPGIAGQAFIPDAAEYVPQQVCTTDGIRFEALGMAEAGMPENISLYAVHYEDGSEEQIWADSQLQGNLTLTESQELHFVPFDVWFSDGEQRVEPSNPVDVLVSFPEDPFGEVEYEDEFERSVISISESGEIGNADCRWISDTEMIVTLKENAVIGPYMISDKGNGMTAEEILLLDEDTVGAAMEIAVDNGDDRGRFWSFDVYYVNGRDGDHDTHAENDFSLKYQMEFHTSKEIPANGVKITIPAALTTTRNGQKILPSQIAVPMVSGPDKHVETRVSPFNCYYQGDDLVFFNYKEIGSGSNASWQVVYSGVDVFKIKDTQSWSLQARCVLDYTPEACQYRAAVEEQPCNHQHDASCGYVPATDATPCDQQCREKAEEMDPSDPDYDKYAMLRDDDGMWNHRHLRGCAYRPGTGAVPCRHVHDANCGYAPAIPGHECTLDCVDTDGDGKIDHVTDPAPVQESFEPEPLRGYVDTSASLLSVSKKPYSQAGSSYTPGIYSEAQLNSFVSGTIDPKFTGEGFKNYKFVVWQISVSGKGTQPADLWIKETPGGTYGEEIVGFSLPNGNVQRYSADLQGKLEGYKSGGTENTRSWKSSFYVVTAYPTDSLSVGQTVRNSVDVELVPYDLIDPDQKKSDEAEWNWRDYEWHYSGDIIGITKSGPGTYEGWLEIYKAAANGKGTVVPDFGFKTTSTNRSFKITHRVPDTGSTGLGERIPGAAVRTVTVDDAVYAYIPEGSSLPGGGSYMLDGSDYYFSSVTVTQQDTGYDVWEDRSGPVETATEEDNIDQGLRIYAMFAEEGGDGTEANQWKEVGYVEWPESVSGNSVSLTYQFKPEDIARHPYRVMAVHDGISYDTFCTISVSLHVRPDSPKLLQAVQSDMDFNGIQFENVSGVFGQKLQYGEPTDGIGTEAYFSGSSISDTGYYQDQFGASFNWSEPGIGEFTDNLYSNIRPMRDSAFAYGNPAEHSAEAWKGGKMTNDVVNGRTDVTYSVTMHEGYRVGSQSIASLLIEAGVPAPDRRGITIYDLLPVGMNFDPSYPVTAGRLQTPDAHASTAWDTSNMEVEYETLDINWEGSGRTMLKFTLKYTGNGIMYRTSGYDLFQGWGISFRGYWDWEDLNISDLTQNIAAFMTSDGDDQPFIADKSDNVDKDNGSHQSPFGYFISDLDKDNNMDDEMLPVEAIVSEEIAMAAQSSLTKTVRADNDKYYHYGDSAVVEPGGTYTYDLTLTNPSRALHDVVIFDRLEHAAEDRKGIPNEIPFEDTHWTGTFRGVVTEALDANPNLRGNYSVWYNANDASGDHIPAADSAENGQTVLTEANGWFQASIWESQGKNLSDVKAVAVSLGTYVLQPMESVSFQILMKAPENTNGATWAYNNGSFSSKVDGATAYKLEACNSVKVRTGATSQMAVEKVFESPDNIPSGMRDTEFEIRLWDTKSDENNREKWTPYSYHEYTLWNKSESGDWTQDPGKRATDDSGIVYLKAGQRAVFSDVPDPNRIKVEEVADPFWKSSVTSETGSDGIFTWRVANEAKTVLYVQKKISGHAADDQEFEFLVETEENGSYQPAKNVTVWIVDRAYTDGRKPQKKSEKTTDNDGKFTLKANETAAIIGSGHFDKGYRVTETDTGENWIVLEDDKVHNGTFVTDGCLETFTNYWRWKDLYLTKEIVDRDASAAANDEFMFMIEEITEKDGKKERTPISGNQWTLSGTDEGGILPETGDFACHAAKGVVKIEKLEALKTYRITEISSGEFYEPVNGGIVEFTMSLYSASDKETIANAWLKRPLEVSKALIYNPNNPEDIENAKTAEFTFTVTCDQDGRGEQTPLANYPYTIKEGGQVIEGDYSTDGSGTFRLKGGQTAVFQDAGVNGSKFTVKESERGTWQQIVPADNADAVGEMTNDGGKAEFVNGSPGSMMIRKEWAGTDETGEAFVEAGMTGNDPDLSVEVTMKVNGSVWPTSDVDVSVVDSAGTLHIAGSEGAGVWQSGKPYVLEPGETIIISGADLGSENASYEITESVYDKRHIEYWDGKHVQVWQTVPENGKALKGTVKDNPVAELANAASGIPEKSRIAKRFTDPNLFAPEGARLVLIVERYDETGKAWLPAEGIPYILGWGNGLGYGAGSDYEYSSDRVEYTEHDGKLALTAKESLMPWVIFIEDTVYAVNVSGEPQNGDLRVRELLDESDPFWGKLAGVGAITLDDSWTADPNDRDWNKGDQVSEAFVNTMDENFIPVQVGKIVNGDSTESFTFILSQITEVDGDAGSITEESIKKTVPGSDITFTVYDKSTGRFLRDGVTDKDGAFALSAGEYAELQLPEKTLWTVKEDIPTGYVLESLKEYLEVAESTEEGSKTESDKLSVLAPNLLLIGADGKYSENRKYTVVLDCDGGDLTTIPEGFSEGPDGVYSDSMLNAEDSVALPEAASAAE